MMTTEEKLEVVKAYSEGKVIEIYSKYSNEWLDKKFDIWDFDTEKYRVKLNKFKVGDRLVYKSDEDYEGIEIYEVTEATQEYYRLDDMINRTPEYVEKEFINIKDVLWYFEVYDYTTKRYSMHPTRMTIPEINEELRAYHNMLSWEPIYALGFKLKEN